MIISLSIRAQIDAQAVTKAIEEQMNTYPESTLKDIYKSFFQDAFGPGHLIPESEEGKKKWRHISKKSARRHGKRNRYALIMSRLAAKAVSTE